MTEPPSLPRAGSLPRDKDGWDVGTVEQENGIKSVRVHREDGDITWGALTPKENGGYIFRSSHSETAASDGLEGDEQSVFAGVVKATGGSLPKKD